MRGARAVARRLVVAEGMPACRPIRSLPPCPSVFTALLAAGALSLASAPRAAHAEAKAGEEAAKPRGLEELAGSEDPHLYSCSKGKGAVTITLKPETEVKELIAWVMSFTCKTFALDPWIVKAGKKVTIVTPKALTPAEAYRVFLVALSTVNLAIVAKGDVYRVVEANTAKKETLPLVRRGLPDATEEIVRYVYRPSYAQAETMSKAFAALKSDAGDIVAIGSVLLLTDYGSHLRDMMSLAKLIDVPGGTDGVYTIPVLHADAAKLAQKLEGFLGITGGGAATVQARRPVAEGAGPGGAGGGAAVDAAAAVPSKIMVDDRTNTLVLASGEAGYLRVKALVERLDIALEVEGGAAFHVYRLKSAIAEELAQTLTQAISGTAAPQAKQQAGARGAAGAGGAAGAAGAQGAGGAGAAAAAADLGASLDGPVRVIADKPSNALIVMSSGRDFLALRAIIRDLDQPRRQVYIEALILEVAVGKGSDLGASMHGALPYGDKGALAVAGVQNGSVSTLNPSSIAGAAGAVAGLLGSQLTSSVLGQTIPSYGVLLSAVASTSDLNIVSAPSIIALDNEETKYKVGLNVPYQKASFTGLGGGDTPNDALQTTYDRKDLVLQLNIKPHISTDDNLLLEVKHEAEDLQGDTAGGPIWSTRSIETRVVVRDQQTVVLGGLLQERDVVKTSKIPLLGDIPLLGHLFKQTTKSKQKTNLVIMLTPYIVKDQLELQAIRERKLREHDEFVSSFRALNAMPYEPRIDYAKKRGLVEEINRTVGEVEAELTARAALRPAPAVLPGVVETPAPGRE